METGLEGIRPQLLPVNRPDRVQGTGEKRESQERNGSSRENRKERQPPAAPAVPGGTLVHGYPPGDRKPDMPTTPGPAHVDTLA